jgi:hypothetical protein
MPRYSFDGEKIRSDDLERVFKMPPGVDDWFPRSALVVGSQGAGKTVLLRRAKAIAGRGGVYVNLYTALNSLTEELGRGGLHLEYDAAIESALRNKSAAIVLASVLVELEAVGLPFIPGLVAPALPGVGSPEGKLASYTEYLYAITRTRLLNYTDHGNTDVLMGSLRAVEDNLEGLDARLAICLDRADSIPWPATYPLFSLLDQSQSCLVLVATRPGISASIAAAQTTSKAGPQYELLQLGTSPYEDEWLQFTRDAVIDYYPASDQSAVPDELLERAIRLGRESLRLMLQLLHFRATTSDWPEIFEERARLRQRILENAARTTLAAVDVDFGHLVDVARGHRRDHPSDDPVLIAITEAEEELWVDSKTRSFVELALRESALVMPHGETWYPGRVPLTLEMPPIFVQGFDLHD